MFRKTTSVVAVIGILAVGNAIGNDVISTDGAARFGADISWWGTYTVGDQWVSNVHGEYIEMGTFGPWAPVAASWGAFYWEAYKENGPPVGRAAVRGRIDFEDPNGNPHSDTSTPITGV